MQKLGIVVIAAGIIVALVAINLAFTKNARYYWWYPAIMSPYPDNREEAVVVVNEYVAKRTQRDVEFAMMVDEAPEKAFQHVISESEMPASEMREIIMHPLVVMRVKAYKAVYNRARPHQVLPDRINLESGSMLPLKTADTPSYPAGHAYQAYLMASILCAKFPYKKREIEEAADRLAESRIYAGVHYPSDNAFSKSLVKNHMSGLVSSPESTASSKGATGAPLMNSP
jgi:membrane-associated phospholipid phosphatase